jgi:hypothetical protein
MSRSLRQFSVCFLVTLLAQVALGSPLNASARQFPIAFEQNRGQAPTDYKYVLHGEGRRALFSAAGVDFEFSGSNSRHNFVHLSFVGGHAEPVAGSALPAHANYFVGSDPGRWQQNVPLFSELNYTELYPGVSLKFYGNGEELEHDFLLDPGVDPTQIALRFDDASSPFLDSNGELVIHAGGESLRMRKPVAYQVIDGIRQSVEASMLQAKDGKIRFIVGHYDHGRPLVIDPVFVFSTYLGGTGADFANAITTDASGNVIVAGSTTSADFPVSNAEQGALGCSQPGNCRNAFVSKFDPTGKTLIFSTYLGGSGQDIASAVAIDPSGDVIVAGRSSSANFPHAGSVRPLTCQINNNCFFLASIKPDGSALNYSGMVGGSEGYYAGPDDGRLAIDQYGNAYLAGTTVDPSFYVTQGTLATSSAGNGNSQLFVLKIDSIGRFAYSTVVPGNAPSDPTQAYTNYFIPHGIAVDASGQVTVVGASGLGLPTTAGVVATQFPNAYLNAASPEAGYVLQLNAAASAINFASYLPGTDVASGLAVDSNGNLWIAGMTTETTLPVSANAYQKVPTRSTLGSTESGYVLKLNSLATAVLGATYLNASGSSNEEYSTLSGIALDSHSNVFLGGTTGASDFPMIDPFATEFESQTFYGDMILAELSSDLSTLEFSTFLNPADPVYGGSSFGGIVIDKSNNLVVTGTTFSMDFPTTPGSFETQLPPPANPSVGFQHSFVTKIDLSTPAPAVCFDRFAVTFGNVNSNTAGTQTLQVTNCGNAPLNINSITSSDSTVVATQSCSPVAPGATCPVTLTFTPVSSNLTNGAITLVDNAVTVPQVIAFSGQGIAPKIVAASNPLALGHILVGTQGPVTNVVLYNQGQATLIISKVTVSGPGFSIVVNACGQLPLGFGSCSLQLVFAPTTSGPSTGSVVITSNDPVNPELTVSLTGTGDSTYSVPVVSSIGTSTVLIGSGPTTMSITGSNFYPQSVVQLNGAALKTTFTDNNDLSAVIPAASITALGELPLTVANPTPGGGVSNGLMVTPYETVLVSPSFLTSVPATGMLYAAMSSSASTNPNTVIPIDPTTASMGSPIAVGTDPAILAPSSDGAYLYVANQTSQTVQRINLNTSAVERTFPYTPNLYCSSCTNLSATDLESVPGIPQEVLLSQGSWLTLYNDSGTVNYVPNDGICCYADPDFGSIALAGNPLTIYGVPFTYGNNYFQIANLTSSGLQYTRTPQVNLGGNNTTGNQVISDGTLLYTSAGQIWDPSTHSEIGTFPINTINAASFPNNRNISLDTSTGEIYSVGDQITGSLEMMVAAFGIKSHQLDGSLAFPQVTYPFQTDIVRWGADGLAFLAPGPGSTDEEVYLLRSSLVSPQAPNPTPVLTSIAPAQAYTGGAAFTLTVTGTGYLATSVIDWNGTNLPTIFVSGQQLTASVPASALAQAGNSQVAVFTPAPGGGNSVAQVFAVLSAVPAALLSQSQLTFADQAQGVTSSAQTVTLTNSGTATLTVSAIAASGNFNATSNCGSSVAINSSCSINVTFTPSASGTRTGALSITDNAANSPQTVGLSGNGVAALTIAPTQGGTTSATVTSGNPATYNLSLTGGPGIVGTVSLACSGAPQYAVCSVSPTSLNLASGATSEFLVTVTTSSTQSASIQPRRTLTLAGLGFASLLILPLLSRARRRSMFILALVCFAVGCFALGVAGCGGGGRGSKTITNTTQPGSYTLTITATSANLSVTQPLKLVVQ